MLMVWSAFEGRFWQDSKPIKTMAATQLFLHLTIRGQWGMMVFDGADLWIYMLIYITRPGSH